MQYERLIKRSRLPLDFTMNKRMETVADIDFLVIMVRRFLRTAEQARKIPSGHQRQLKLAMKIFDSRWGHLDGVRSALEHSDTAAMLPVPMTSFSASDKDGGQFVFMWPGGNLDLRKLYEDAQSILKAILRVIEPLEAERDTPKKVSS